MQQPGANKRPAVHEAEIVENGVGLRTDRLPLARDQLPLAHVDGGNALLREQVFNQPLGEGGVDAQIAAALQIAGQQASPNPAARFRQALQLQQCGLLQLLTGHTADDALLQHAALGLGELLLPLRQLTAWQIR